MDQPHKNCSFQKPSLSRCCLSSCTFKKPYGKEREKKLYSVGYLSHPGVRVRTWAAYLRVGLGEAARWRPSEDLGLCLCPVPGQLLQESRGNHSPRQQRGTGPGRHEQVDFCLYIPLLFCNALCIWRKYFFISNLSVNSSDGIGRQKQVDLWVSGQLLHRNSVLKNKQKKNYNGEQCLPSSLKVWHLLTF